ncbi:hypothetical protein [Roseospira visakhapatnamensis]|uniref:Uncharacterized protein n=1 Tax=Roseospira visakhapatnamensis TaxID=390880 RepID=A0A7W6RCA4_9PROT|nr:hypothetical protein [Roseospira visakhapatnamensis]MBB4265516.1 hypothetical protein [Roseospira visakhapatnamensis]
MADIQGMTGSAVQTARTTTARPAVAAIDGRGGGGGGADGPQATRARAAEVPAPQVIRFEGMDLDPNAPRGTYLDILV